jgi:hypothetical protein
MDGWTPDTFLPSSLYSYKVEISEFNFYSGLKIMIFFMKTNIVNLSAAWYKMFIVFNV